MFVCVPDPVSSANDTGWISRLTCLPDHKWKVVYELERCDFGRCLLNSSAELCIKCIVLDIDGRGSSLQYTERLYYCWWHPVSWLVDLKILQTPLGLATPKPVAWNLHSPKCIGLDAELPMLVVILHLVLVHRMRLQTRRLLSKGRCTCWR